MYICDLEKTISLVMQSFSIDRLKYKNFLLFLAFYFIVFFSFTWVVRFEYAFVKSKLVYILDYARFGIGFAVFVLCALLLTILKVKDFLYSILSLLLVFFVLPSAVLFAYVKGIDPKILLSHVFLFIVVIAFGYLKIKIKSKKLEIKQSVRLLTAIVTIGLIPFILIFLPYINIRNLLLVDIYETRELMDVNVTNAYVNYTYSWFNKVIIPCLLVFGIYFKNRITIALCTGALIFLFLCGAHKAVFIGLIFVFLLYKFNYIRKINYLLKVLSVIGISALFMSLLIKNDFLMTLSIRRAILLPSMVDVLYFDFFENNYLYWSESLNGLFKDYPYSLSHSFVIGQKYFGYSIWGANNGIISDGFMNFGMIGVFINILLVALYISLLNQLDISPRFFGIFFLFIIAILSSSLTTVLVTHGGIILIFLAFFFMKNTNEQMG